VSKTSFSSEDIFISYKLIYYIISYKKGTHKKFLFTYLFYVLYNYLLDICSSTQINLSLETYFLLIFSGKASKNAFHQFVEYILSSSNTTIPVSFFVRISLQNHCLSFIIALGIEYSVKGSLKNTLLA
jgi:hypothetical protein